RFKGARDLSRRTVRSPGQSLSQNSRRKLLSQTLVACAPCIWPSFAKSFRPEAVERVLGQVLASGVVSPTLPRPRPGPAGRSRRARWPSRGVPGCPRRRISVGGGGAGPLDWGMVSLPKPQIILTHGSDLDGLVSGVLLQRLAKKMFAVEVPLE